METSICKTCGRELPVSSFKMTRWGTRSAVCNKCASELCTKTKAAKKAEKEKEQRELRLRDFTPRELMEELSRRGYEGKLTYTHIETIDITNF